MIVTGKLTFGNTVDYVKYLEEGTEKMKPRPAMWLSIQNNKKNTETIIGQKIEEAYTKK